MDLSELNPYDLVCLDLPSVKYSCPLSDDMFTNGSTAIECSGTAAAWFTPRRSTKRSVSSSTTATASTPMIAKSSLRRCGA